MLEEKQENKRPDDILQLYQSNNYEKLLETIIHNDLDEILNIRQKTEMQDDSKINISNVQSQKDDEDNMSFNEQESVDFLDQVTSQQKRT